MQIKAFMDEAKHENIDFEKSSSDSDGVGSVKSTTRKMLNSNDHRAGGGKHGNGGDTLR